jgi:hypothetical protein
MTNVLTARQGVALTGSGHIILITLDTKHAGDVARR